jgi:hypothetical protein
MEKNNQMHAMTLVEAPFRSAAFAPQAREGMMACMMVASLAYAGAALGKAAAPAPAARAEAPLILELSAGFADGLTVDAAQPRMVWYQALPRHTRMREGKLVLNLTGGFDPGHRIGLRVNINGSPRAVFHPAASSGESAQHTVNIALAQTDLVKETLAVELSFEALEQLNQHGCRDIDMTSFMRALPDSSLVLVPASAQANGIGAYLERLPKQVDLALPAQPDIGAIHTAWHLIAMLREQGHAVRVRSHPALGHVVVANVAQWPEETRSHGSRDMQLVTTSGGSTLFVSDTLAAERTALGLSPLMRETRFSTRVIDRKRVESDSVPLADVLSSPLRQESFGSVRWDGYLSSRQVPRGHLPSGLALRLIATPSKRGSRISLHVFVDDVLIQTAKLRADGAPEGVDIQFPRSQQRDRIRIRLRVDEEGRSLRCFADAGTPIQLLGESAVKLKRSDAAALAERNFSALGRSFVAPFTVYLDRSAIQNAAATVGILSRLTEGYDAQPGQASLAMAGSLDEVSEGPDFVWLSALPPNGANSSLSVADAALRVRDRSGIYTLPTAELRGMSVAALVRKNARLGLWMRPGDADFPLNVPETLALGDGDIAFYDDRAVMLTTNHFAAGPAALKVTETAYVKPLMNKFNWFSAALWVVVALLLAGGVRMALRGRRK